MNTLKDSNPPLPMPALDCASEDPVIGVRILVPDTARNAVTFRGSNRLATLILFRVLHKRLEATGIVVKSAGFAFPFNKSCYVFTVATKPAGPALAVVREELASVGFLDLAQIAWRDHAELVWRLYYPESGIFRAPSTEECDADLRRTTEMREAIQNQKQRDGTPGQ